MKISLGKKKGKNMAKKAKNCVDVIKAEEENVGKRPIFRMPTSQTIEAECDRLSSDFFKLSVGANRILILPTTEEMNLNNDFLPWADISAHYVGGKDVMDIFGIAQRPEELPLAYGCDRARGRDCAWCARASKLKQSRNKLDRSLGAALRASNYNIANVIDLNKPTRCRLFKFGRNITSDLVLALGEGLHFCNPANLLEIRIMKTQLSSAQRDVRYNVSVQNDARGSMERRRGIRMEAKRRGIDPRAAILADPALRAKGPMWPEWIDSVTDLSQYIFASATADDVQDVMDMFTSVHGGGKEVGADVISDDDLDIDNLF